MGIWCKDVAPSKQLREWYHYQPERFDEFAGRYEAELTGNTALEELRKLTRRGVVTLVTATRDLDGSQAAVLASYAKAAEFRRETIVRCSSDCTRWGSGPAPTGR